jgi:hypothetical protein
MNRNKLKLLLALGVFILALLIYVKTLSAEEQPYYFYQPLPYGSQATYTPLTLLFNGGFGICQIPEYYGVRSLFDLPYRDWNKAMWRTVGHPIRSLNAYGWKHFATSYMIPTSFDLNRSQWVPKWFDHVLGGGLHYRKTEEWYRYNGYSHPRLWAFGTINAYHYFEELMENKGDTTLSMEYLGDIEVFGPISILLWSNDGVCRFFSQKLQMQEWSLQPAINVKTGNLENMGQFYVVKYPITRDKSWSLMGHWGLDGTAGISHRLADGHSISLTGGLVVENLIPATKTGPGTALTATTTWRADAFYDLNNSLLASVMLCGIADRRLKVNIYPGVLKLGQFRPGFFLSGTREWVVGMNVSCFPLGVAQGIGSGSLSPGG